MRLINQTDLPSATIAEIETTISQQENLLDVLRWAAGAPDQFLPTVVANVVVQDEFTHDVIVPWRDLVLVYDTT